MSGARRLAAGVVGHLVGFESLGLEHPLGGLVEAGGEVGVSRGEGLSANRPVERGARLDGQLVGREVLGPEVERRLQLLGPAGFGLAWAGVDQVERQAREGAGGQARGAYRFRRRVVAAQETEGAVVERLDAQGQPVHARCGEGLETRGFGVGRVGLQRDLQGRRRWP